MNKCLNCGAEFVNDNFCPYCGTRLDKEQIDQVSLDNQANEELTVKPTKTWYVFANLGFIFGLVGIIVNVLTIFISMSPDMIEVGSSFLSLGEIVIPGLIFSILGRKSILKSGKAKAGIILNIIGIVLSVIAVVVYIVTLITVLGELTYGPGGGFYTTFFW